MCRLGATQAGTQEAPAKKRALATCEGSGSVIMCESLKPEGDSARNHNAGKINGLKSGVETPAIEISMHSEILYFGNGGCGSRKRNLHSAFRVPSAVGT